jgi:(p)ppGpp synthase/HD superfamily hydrolase
MDDLPLSDVAAVMARFGAKPCSAPATRQADFVALGPRFDRALLYASAAHRQQPRKGAPIPYLSHLLGVASIVLTYRGSEDQAIAGLLHDTVEDCGNEHTAAIEELFGKAVRDMVLACSDSAVPAGEAKGDWRSRKDAYLSHLEELDVDDPALLVSCADKLHNAGAILADLEADGPPFWNRFPGRRPEDILWYYGALAAFFTETLASPLAQRLQATVDGIIDLQERLAVEAPET